MFVVEYALAKLWESWGVTPKAMIGHSVGALVVRGESPRQALDLAEVEYLLRSATERLALYGDVRTADQALMLADQQLEALDDPVYLSVRDR